MKFWTFISLFYNVHVVNKPRRDIYLSELFSENNKHLLIYYLLNMIYGWKAFCQRNTVVEIRLYYQGFFVLKHSLPLSNMNINYKKSKNIYRRSNSQWRRLFKHCLEEIFGELYCKNKKSIAFSFNERRITSGKVWNLLSNRITPLAILVVLHCNSQIQN